MIQILIVENGLFTKTDSGIIFSYRGSTLLLIGKLNIIAYLRNIIAYLRQTEHSQRISDIFCHKLYVLSMFVLWSYVSDVALYVGCSCIWKSYGLDLGALIECVLVVDSRQSIRVWMDSFVDSRVLYFFVKIYTVMSKTRQAQRPPHVPFNFYTDILL